MYSLVSAPVLGFDLTRLPGGSATADILLRALSLTDSDILVVAAAATDEWERAELWQDIDAAAQQRRNAASEQNGPLTVLERTPLGTVDGLLYCLRHDVLDWTWDGRRGPRVGPIPHARTARERQTDMAVRATSVLADAAAAAYLRDLLPEQSRRRLSTPWQIAARQLPERPLDLGPQRADLELLLARVSALTSEEMGRLAVTAERVRPMLNDWAPAVHSASWAVFLSARVRVAAAAQLRLVQAVDRAGVPVGQRAGGVWNLLSGAVQAMVVRDVLDSPTAIRLLDPYYTALSPQK